MMNLRSLEGNDKQDHQRNHNLSISSPLWSQFLPKNFNNKPPEEIKEDVSRENTWDDAAEERKKYDYWVLEIARVYRSLSNLPKLNNRQATCMLKILELSEFDDALNYLINEVDEVTFNELKVYDSNFQVNEQKILEFEEETWKYFKLLIESRNLPDCAFI